MISPDLLSDLPRKIADELAALAPGLRECAVHESRLTLEEVTATRIAAPAVRVVLLGARPGAFRAGPQLVFDLAFVAYIVAADRRGLDRDAAALNIAQAVMARVAGARWGDPEVGPATAVAMDALSNSATRKAGLALRAVTWTQPVAFDRAAAESGAVPSELYLGRAPEIGAAHEPDYELASGGGS